MNASQQKIGDSLGCSQRAEAEANYNLELASERSRDEYEEDNNDHHDNDAESLVDEQRSTSSDGGQSMQLHHHHQQQQQQQLHQQQQLYFEATRNEHQQQQQQQQQMMMMSSAGSKLAPAAPRAPNMASLLHEHPISAARDFEDVKQVELFGENIVALTINGKERLCLAQISNTLLKQFSYNEIHNRRVALGITCVQCTPIQLEMLRRAGAMPSSSRRCGMITMREAERLCRSFLIEEQPPELPENFYFTVAHRINYGCKGRFVPARYISSRAKCIECFYCGDYYSPNKFIFHSHRQADTNECNPPDSPNINSWRKHIDLDHCHEHSQDIKYAWEDVKSLFNGGTRRKNPNAPTSHHQTGAGANTQQQRRENHQLQQKMNAQNGKTKQIKSASAAEINAKPATNVVPGDQTTTTTTAATIDVVQLEQQQEAATDNGLARKRPRYGAAGDQLAAHRQHAQQYQAGLRTLPSLQHSPTHSSQTVIQRQSRQQANFERRPLSSLISSSGERPAAFNLAPDSIDYTIQDRQQFSNQLALQQQRQEQQQQLQRQQVDFRLSQCHRASDQQTCQLRDYQQRNNSAMDRTTELAKSLGSLQRQQQQQQQHQSQVPPLQLPLPFLLNQAAYADQRAVLQPQAASLLQSHPMQPAPKAGNDSSGASGAGSSSAFIYSQLYNELAQQAFLQQQQQQVGQTNPMLESGASLNQSFALRHQFWASLLANLHQGAHRAPELQQIAPGYAGLLAAGGGQLAQQTGSVNLLHATDDVSTAQAQEPN